MQQRKLAVLILTVLVCGCVSPMTRLEQDDLRWYAEDRYKFADAMPEATREEGLRKIEAYWETIETIRHIKDQDTLLTLDGEPMKRDAAREHVKRKIQETEEAADITATTYCGTMTGWTLSIPGRFVKTSVDAICIFAESPVSNIEW